MKTLLILSTVLFTATGCQAAERLDSLFGDAGAQGVVAKPTKVQAYRLADKSFYQPTVKDYKTTAGPIAVDEALAARLSKLLLDRDNYLWDVAKGCEPIFGVRLEFTQGDKSVDLFFCFECDILAVYFRGKPVGSEDFDTMRPQLVEIVQKIFPDDMVIQDLKG